MEMVYILTQVGQKGDSISVHCTVEGAKDRARQLNGGYEPEWIYYEEDDTWFTYHGMYNIQAYPVNP